VKPDSTAENSDTGGHGRTQADQLMERYRKLGEAQKHQFGEGGPGTPPPNFNLKVPGVNAPANTTSSPTAAKPGLTKPEATAPAATGPKTVVPKPVAVKPPVPSPPARGAATQP
jgi:hypothetical protein